MNLIFRYLYHIIVSKFLSPMDINDTDRARMRVWPNDLDANIHLNNGRFLSLMDLGRTRMSIRSGLYAKAKQNGLGLGVVGGVNITYLKSLAAFQQFELTTRLAGHHDGWIYIEQRFESRGKLVAAALVKVVFLKEKKRADIQEMFKSLEVDHIGENKEYLANLFNSEQEFLRYIKKDY
jgi:acyl-CoA thioesterase FadM